MFFFFNNNDDHYGDGDYDGDGDYIVDKKSDDNDKKKTIPELCNRTDIKRKFSKEKQGGRLT